MQYVRQQVFDSAEPVAKWSPRESSGVSVLTSREATHIHNPSCRPDIVRVLPEFDYSYS